MADATLHPPEQMLTAGIDDSLAIAARPTISIVTKILCRLGRNHWEALDPLALVPR
jgi:hypothetical protein